MRRAGLAAVSTPYVSGTGTCAYGGTGQICYAAQGAIQSLTLYNGVSETWGFNTLQQPNSLVAAKGGTALMTLGWAYNTGANNGNVAGHTIQRSSGLAAVLSQTFSYADPANRLKTMTEAGGPSQTYLYDAVGNRAVQAGSWVPNLALTPQSAVATPATFPTSQFTNNQWRSNTGDAYDGAGNQTQLAASSGIFTYDGENRLLSANVLNEGLVTFAYDGEGRRVQKTSGLGTTTYVHDAMGNLAAEYGTQAPTATGTQYLTADTLGSTRLVTDGLGNPARCIDYLPFGEEIPSGQNGRTGCYEGLGGGSGPQYPAPPDVQGLKFTGKERDAETGLDFFGGRYFSGPQGRFTTPDWSPTQQPIPYADLTDPQTLNLYSYVRNNPLSKADADGHADVDTLLKHTFEIVGTFERNAGTVASKGIGLLGNALGAVAMIVLNPTLAGGKDEIEFERQIQVAPGGNGSRNGGNDKSTAVSPGPDGMKPGSSNPEGAGKPFDQATKNAARSESGDRCVFCDKETTRESGPNQSQIDHANPKSRGGDNSIDNAQNTCRTCNLDKGTRTTEEYLKHLKDNQ